MTRARWRAGSPRELGGSWAVPDPSRSRVVSPARCSSCALRIGPDYNPPGGGLLPGSITDRPSSHDGSRKGEQRMGLRDETGSEADRDAADLAKFGDKQELRRTLGVFSSFAVAFSYISPSTGIFTLYFLGLVAVGGYLFWTWPIVALGQFIVALNF